MSFITYQPWRFLLQYYMVLYNMNHLVQTNISDATVSEKVLNIV